MFRRKQIRFKKFTLDSESDREYFENVFKNRPKQLMTIQQVKILVAGKNVDVSHVRPGQFMKELDMYKSLNKPDLYTLNQFISTHKIISSQVMNETEGFYSVLVCYETTRHDLEEEKYELKQYAAKRKISVKEQQDYYDEYQKHLESLKKAVTN